MFYDELFSLQNEQTNKKLITSQEADMTNQLIITLNWELWAVIFLFPWDKKFGWASFYLFLITNIIALVFSHVCYGNI